MIFLSLRSYDMIRYRTWWFTLIGTWRSGETYIDQLFEKRKHIQDHQKISTNEPGAGVYSISESAVSTCGRSRSSFYLLAMMRTTNIRSLMLVAPSPLRATTAFFSQPPLTQRQATKARATNQQKEQQPYFDAGSAAPNSSSSPAPPRFKRSHRILCYGDSLTAGLVTDSNNQQYSPYAPHLETALNQSHMQQQQQQQQQRHYESSSLPATGTTDTALAQAQQPPVVRVRPRGIPGWTAHTMTQDLDGPSTGLRSALQALSAAPRIAPSGGGGEVLEECNRNAAVSLVIILAGTNDIGYGYSAHEIAQNVIALHRTCLDQCGVARTLCIAVPPSAYQAIHAPAAALVRDVNRELQQACCQSQEEQQQKHRTTTFMAFPFKYDSRKTTETNWCADGLHFSVRGYQSLGESLAPVVASILQELEAEQEQ
jgi:GDSL-like Lipase/Acylhydrolase family